MEKQKLDTSKLDPPLFGETPWLVYTHGRSKHKQCQTFTPSSPLSPNNKSYIKSIPQLRGQSIEASFNKGWLLLRDVINDKPNCMLFSLYNIVTSKSVHLPEFRDWPDEPEVGLFSLISTPDLDDCVVFLFFWRLVFYCWPARKATWVHQETEIDGRSLLVTSTAVLNNVIYAMGIIDCYSDDESDDESENESEHKSEDDFNHESEDETNHESDDESDRESDAETENESEHESENDFNHESEDETNHESDDESDQESDDNEDYNYLLRKSEYTIVSIEVDDASNSLTFKNLQLEWPKCSINNVTQHRNLLESCSAIYCVNKFIRHSLQNRYSVVKVFELDLRERKWVEVNCLNGRAFFIGEDKSCTWCWGMEASNNSIPGDCIYYQYKEIMYSYKLQENSVTLLQVCPTLMNPIPSVVWLRPQLLEQQGRKQMIKKANTHNKETSSAIAAESLPQRIEMQESFLCQLPLHLIECISKKLQSFDYLDLRATCKLFRYMGCDDEKIHPSFLYFKDDNQGSYQVINPFRGNSRSIILQPSQYPYTIDFVKDGWLVINVHHPTHCLQYLNPFTRVRGEYPCNDEVTRATCIGFSTHPTSLDCLTVGFVDCCTGNVCIYYHRYGDSEWTRTLFQQQAINFRPGVSSPVYYNGAFYLLSTDGYLGAFELTDNGEETWQVYDKPQMHQPKDYRAQKSSHLVVCNGQLYSVFFGHYGKCVNVFRFNILTKKWIPVKNIGNYCFFVSHRSSFSLQTTEASMRSRIYLPRFKGNGMVFYCLKSRKYVVCGSEDSLKDWFSTTEPLNSCWI